MKKLIFLALVAALAVPQLAQADIIAGWDTFGGTGAASAESAPVTATGITASFVSTTEQQAWNLVDERGASDDGTWGSSTQTPSPSTIVGSGNDQNLELPNATSGGTLTFTLTNNGTDDIDLQQFHFDAAAFRFRAATTYALSVLPGGGISDGAIFTSAAEAIPVANGGVAPTTNDYHGEFDHAFVGADTVLGIGESVDILLAFSGGTGGGNGGHDLWVDNIAVTGTVVAIPEPSSLALLGLAGVGIFVRRRK